MEKKFRAPLKNVTVGFITYEQQEVLFKIEGEQFSVPKQHFIGSPCLPQKKNPVSVFFRNGKVVGILDTFGVNFYYTEGKKLYFDEARSINPELDGLPNLLQYLVMFKQQHPCEDEEAATVKKIAFAAVKILSEFSMDSHDVRNLENSEMLRKYYGFNFEDKRILELAVAICHDIESGLDLDNPQLEGIYDSFTFQVFNKSGLKEFLRTI